MIRNLANFLLRGYNFCSLLFSIKIIIVSCFLYNSINVLNAQSFSGYIFDKKGESISYASILNIRNEKFTFSNENGFFKIPVNELDTIEISHLSFETRRHIVKNILEDTIYLHNKSILLDEVKILPKTEKPTKVITIGKEIKKKNTFGLAINREYAYRISNLFDKPIKLESMTIPVRFKKNISVKGVFQLQLFEQGIDGMITNIPLSKLYEIPINEIGKKIYLKFIENIVVSNKNNFYIVMKRAISGTIFNSKNPKLLSVNPYIFFEKNHNNVDSIFFDRPIPSSGKWVEMNKYRFGAVPKFCIKIEAKIIE